jgi:hypothetical protein
LMGCEARDSAIERPGERTDRGAAGVSVDDDVETKFLHTMVPACPGLAYVVYRLLHAATLTAYPSKAPGCSGREPIIRFLFH